jgi:hypothetical protein
MLSTGSVDENTTFRLMSISTRSVFVRDPKERFLGLFLDKVVQTEHLYERCCIKKKTEEKQEACREKINHVTSFVEMTRECRDTLWGSQVRTCKTNTWSGCKRRSRVLTGWRMGRIRGEADIGIRYLRRGKEDRGSVVV